jgi:3-oxoacyl-[acyl-carrier protein] reductase
MAKYSGRVAIVTGGSGGIGRASAERLAADGFSVVVHYAGGKDRAEDAVRAITHTGGRAVAAGGDVADDAAMTAVFDAADQEFGGVDVVVHAAGIMPLAPIAEMDLDTFDRIQRTNVRGTFVVDQLAARRVRPGARSSTSPHRSPGCRCRATVPTPRPKVPSRR